MYETAACKVKVEVLRVTPLGGNCLSDASVGVTTFTASASRRWSSSMGAVCATTKH